MKVKVIRILLIIVLALVILWLRKGNNGRPSPNKPASNEQASIDRDRGFDRRISYLEYSTHAVCRMKCRQISRAEVQEIMREGKINYSKSDINNARCPRYALEGRTNDDQRVRIVYAQCNESTTVVTVIDLEKDWSCHCPGDD